MRNPGELGSSNYPVSPSLPLLLTPQVNLTQQCTAGPSGGVVSNLMGRGGGQLFGGDGRESELGSISMFVCVFECLCVLREEEYRP